MTASSRSPWSHEERETFVDAFRRGGIAEARRLLPHRSSHAMRNKVNELGIGMNLVEAPFDRMTRDGSIRLLDRVTALFERTAAKHGVSTVAAGVMHLQAVSAEKAAVVAS